MKIFTIFAACCAILMPAIATASTPASPLRVIKKMQGKNHSNAIKNGEEGFRKVLENKSEYWKPTDIKTYGWTGKKWALQESYTCKYDLNGNVVNEICFDSDGEVSNTDFQYDDYNKVVYKETKVSSDGVNFEDNKRTKFEYDPILHNVITLREEWLWMNNDWQMVGNCYRRAIRRNDDGNVTSVIIAVPYNGEYDPIQRLIVTYGEDGKASEIKQELLDYDGKDFFWVLEVTIKDIVWEITDGQIYDYEQLFFGKNRIKSATYFDDEATMTINVDYMDGGIDGYYLTGVIVDEGETYNVKVEYIEQENGGYTLTSETIDADGEIETEREEVCYDEWGHLTLSYIESTDEEGTEIEENTVGTVEFDGDGFPLSYTITESYYDERKHEMVTENVFKEEYSGYIDVRAGVESIVNDSDAPVRYFNLQGMPLDKPIPGQIVIMRQGERSTKIRIKK